MLDLLDKIIIRRMSGDIPLSPEPYKIIAEELGISEKTLLVKLQGLYNSGAIRRISGILYHRKSGYKANAMVVWEVPEDKIDEIGEYLSFLPEITHCYERPIFSHWPYNLFTMIHSESKDECEEKIKKIAHIIKINNYKILYSIKELKKSSMKYFMDEKY